MSAYNFENEILTMFFSSNVCSTSSNNNNSICSGNTSNTECGTSLPGIPGNHWTFFGNTNYNKCSTFLFELHVL